MLWAFAEEIRSRPLKSSVFWTKLLYQAEIEVRQKENDRNDTCLSARSLWEQQYADKSTQFATCLCDSRAPLLTLLVTAEVIENVND